MSDFLMSLRRRRLATEAGFGPTDEEMASAMAIAGRINRAERDGKDADPADMAELERLAAMFKEREKASGIDFNKIEPRVPSAPHVPRPGAEKRIIGVGHGSDPSRLTTIGSLLTMPNADGSVPASWVGKKDDEP